MSKKNLQEQLTLAIKSQDETRKSTLRMVLSAITYLEIRKGGAGYHASQEDIEEVIQSEVKKHKDSIEQYKKGQRSDLVEKEESELKILMEFLPKQLGQEEIEKLVDEAIVKSNATTKAHMGQVMGILMPQIKGKAEGSLVSKLVLEKLS